METHPVTVRSLRVLRGPNLYAYMPVLHAVMDIGPYDERPSNSFPGFVDRLVAWLPTLHKHECSVGRPGGFIERLRRGTYLGHIVEHITLELQMRMGFDVAYGRARGTGELGVYNVTIEYKEEAPALEAFHTALRLVQAAMHDEPFDIEAELWLQLVTAYAVTEGQNSGAVRAALRRLAEIRSGRAEFVLEAAFSCLEASGSGRYREAASLADGLIALYHRTVDPPTGSAGYYMRGLVDFFLGRLDDAGAAIATLLDDVPQPGVRER